MAVINYLLFAALVITFPFVENAPSGKKNSKEDELRTRLVFVDNTDNAINSNSYLIADGSTSHIPTLKQKSGLTTSKHNTEPVSTQTEPPVVEYSELTKMNDERQNWGLVVEETDLAEEESYYNRPLSIPRNIDTKVLETQKKNDVQPKVKETVASINVQKPSACDMGIITCCGILSDLNECFKSQNCFSLTDDMLSSMCTKTSINKSIEIVAKYYRGVLAS